MMQATGSFFPLIRTRLDRKGKNGFNVFSFVKRIIELGLMVKVSAILLAAGESKRMGVSKLALLWGAETVLEHCLHVLLRSRVMEVVVVLSDRTRDLKDLLRGPRVKLAM